MKNKIKSLILISSPIIVVSTVLASVYAIKLNSKGNTKEKEANNGVVIDNDDKDDVATSRFDPNVKYRKSEIFPELRIEDIYQFIKIDNGVPYLSKDIVARIIKIVVTGLGVTFGELNFEWQFKTQAHLIINTYWYEKSGDMKNDFNYLLMKIYSIKITTN